MKLVIFALLLLLTSCTQPLLHIRTDYLSRKNLASYRVGTPDPLLNDPPVGQRLIISWFLPPSYSKFESLWLYATIRFFNGEEISLEFPIDKMIDTYVYSILDENYFETRGIMTYKVDLVADGVVLKDFRHQLWAERIVLRPNE